MTRNPQLEPLNFIRNEVSWLRRKWCAFRRLSVEGHNDDGVLSESAPEFFEVVQRALMFDVGLTICRLTDQTRDTEALKGALARVKNRIPDVDFKRLKESLDQIDQRVTHANLRTARHKVLAHNDREIALGSAVAPSSKLHYVDDIIESISSWVIELHGAAGFACKFDETGLHSSVDILVKQLGEVFQ